MAFLGQDRIPEIVVSSLRASTVLTTSASFYSVATIASIISTPALTPTPQPATSTSASIPTSASTLVSPTTNMGLTESAKFGIGIGVPFGVLLLGILFLIVFRLRRRSPEDTNARNLNVSESEYVNDNNVKDFVQLMSELSGEAPRHEMHTLLNSHELETKREKPGSYRS